MRELVGGHLFVTEKYKRLVLQLYSLSQKSYDLEIGSAILDADLELFENGEGLVLHVALVDLASGVAVVGAG